MSLALFSIPVFIMLSTNAVTSLAELMLSVASPSKESSILSILLSKVIYFSITRPLFSNNNLIVSIDLLFVVSAKHTFILFPSIPKGIALFFLTISNEMYSDTFILISASVNKIAFSPKISPIAFINSSESHKCNM